MTLPRLVFEALLEFDRGGGASYCRDLRRASPVERELLVM